MPPARVLGTRVLLGTGAAPVQAELSECVPSPASSPWGVARPCFLDSTPRCQQRCWTQAHSDSFAPEDFIPRSKDGELDGCGPLCFSCLCWSIIRRTLQGEAYSAHVMGYFADLIRKYSGLRYSCCGSLTSQRRV